MGLFNVFVAYKFIKLIVKPFDETDAYKLGLIDKKGLALKKKSEFTSKEKGAYSAIHELVWNIKRLLLKVPGLKSRLGSFAVAFVFAFALATFSLAFLIATGRLLRCRLRLCFRFRCGILPLTFARGDTVFCRILISFQLR